MDVQSHYTHLNESVSTRLLARVKLTNSGIDYTKATGVKTDSIDLAHLTSEELADYWRMQQGVAQKKEVWREHGGGDSISIPLFRTSKLCLVSVFGIIEESFVGTGANISVGSATSTQAVLGTQVLANFTKTKFWCRQSPFDSTAPNTSVISDILWYDWSKPEVLIAPNTTVYLNLSGASGLTAGDITFDCVATSVGLEFHGDKGSLLKVGSHYNGKDFGCIYPMF